MLLCSITSVANRYPHHQGELAISYLVEWEKTTINSYEGRAG